MKKTTWFVALSLSLLLSLAVKSNVAHQHQARKVDEVCLDIGTVEDRPDLPIQSLSMALKRNVNTRVFRILWRDDVLGFHSTGIVLYDRRTHRVHYWRKAFHEGSLTHENYMFTGVEDAVFSKIAIAHQRDAGGSWAAFFDELPKYGCQKHELP